MKISWWNILWIQVLVTGIIICLYPYMICAYKYVIRALKKKDRNKGVETQPTEIKVSNQSGVMGSTKTVLPQVQEQKEEKEVEETEDQEDQPIMSYTLKQEIPENVEVESEPDDYEIEYGEDPNYKVFKEYNPDYNPHQAEADTSGFSSGVTFEQLNDTIDVMAGRKNSEKDRDAAAIVLMAIEDTDMIQFNLVMSDSKVIIESIIGDYLKRNSGPRANTDFDIQKYIL